MKPLSDQQRLFPVESDQLYREWRELVWRRQGYKYGMRWINVNGGGIICFELPVHLATANPLDPAPQKQKKYLKNFKMAKNWLMKNIKGLKPKLPPKQN